MARTGVRPCAWPLAGWRAALRAALCALVSAVVGEESAANENSILTEHLDNFLAFSEATTRRFGGDTSWVDEAAQGRGWSSAHRLKEAIEARGGEVNLLDIGTLRSLAEIELLEIVLGSQGHMLTARNLTEAKDPEKWLTALAADLLKLAETLPGDRHVISAAYVVLYWLMFNNMRADPDGMARYEAFSSLTQSWWLGTQAAGAGVRQICEVGFNAGHSALSMLVSNPSATLVSFDLVASKYAEKCSDFVSRVFPDRFRLVAGPSNLTLPSYARENFIAPRCDLVYIDGGHTFEDARDDLLHMSLLSVPGRTLVIMDDVGCEESEYCVGPEQAWRRFQEAGRLRELGCMKQGFRRWCWGHYI